MIKVLVVDDARDTTIVLERVLSAEGYKVQTASDGAEGLRKAYDFRPDLILLDLMMPGMNGWTMLERLREFSDVPVIMVTAMSGEENLVSGLEGGADDYLVKPYSLKELKARIRAVLRRAGQSGDAGDRPLTFDGGALAIDPIAQQATVRGERADLSPTEYKLLLCLASNAGRVLSPEQLLDNVWGPGYENSADNVKLYIWYLRRKVEEDPANPRYILTRRGGGYYLADLP
ncbi:MAG: response regulator transcription factor [Anaerolineae bacterium]|nr:response regulator transcription factor [Anaerolineae bacterium]